MVKKAISKSDIWGAFAIIIGIVAWVFQMMWWVKLILMVIATGVSIYVAIRLPSVINETIFLKFFISICIIICFALISWYPIHDQWMKDHPLPTAKEKQNERLKLSINPDSIKFSDSKWSSERSVEIKNNTDETLYGIWVRIQASGNNFKFNNITVETENIDKSLTKKLGTDKDYIEWNYDVIQLEMIDNNTGVHSKYLVIYRLEGLKSKFIRISKKAVPVDNPQNKLTLSLQIIGFKNEPSPLTTWYENNKIGVQLKPPFASKPIWVVLAMSKD